MWCFLNNLRQSFQSRILNLVFDLLLGFYEEPMTVNVVFISAQPLAALFCLPSGFMLYPAFSLQRLFLREAGIATWRDLRQPCVPACSSPALRPGPFLPSFASIVLFQHHFPTKSASPLTFFLQVIFGSFGPPTPYLLPHF